MPPRDTPHPYEPTARRYRTLTQRRRITDEEREIEQQQDEQRRNRFAHQNRTHFAEWRQQRRRERLVQEHDEFVNDLLNFEFQQEPIPTFEGIALPPPPRIQRQQAQRVTTDQNQQNIQNQQNQPHPFQFL